MKKEPQTIKEANYRLYDTKECQDCRYSVVEEYRRGIHYCYKFNRTIDINGVCDFYE